MKKSCGICGGPNQATTIEKSGEYAPVKIGVRGMPAAKCSHGHFSPVEPEFMLWLIHELKDKQTTLAAGNESGMLFFKKYTCACGAALADKSERRQSFPLELAYEGFPAFMAEVEAPVYKCTGCGKEQLRSHNAVRSHTSQAVARLHDAAGFPHAG